MEKASSITLGCLMLSYDVDLETTSLSAILTLEH